MEPLVTITQDSDFPIYRKARTGVMQDGFVRKEDLGDLVEDERYLALCFKIRKEFEYFGDTPVMGAESFKPRFLTTEGPYKQEPEVNNEERVKRRIMEIAVRRFIPSKDLPVSIYALYERKFGFDGKLSFYRKEQAEKLGEAREQSKERIKQIASESTEHKSRLSALVDNSLVTYNFSGDRFGRESAYVLVLGRESKAVERVLAETGIVTSLREANLDIFSFDMKDSKSQYLSLGEIPFSAERGVYGFFQDNRDKLILE